MGRHKVTTEELQDAIGRLEAFERTLQAAIANADRHADELHQTWSGDAATAHRQAHREWRDGTAAMHAALGVMRQIATTAHGNYHAAIHANTTMWRF